MFRSDDNSPRELKTECVDSDLVIVGGGLAGTCAAITAARAGLRVALVQDRPVLGGNASSEVRLWVLGATSHMGNNNRWAREGGVVNELLLECAYRNPEGNPLIFDTIMLEKVVSEPNIRLLLNTAAHDVQMAGGDAIKSVTAFCSQNSTRYVLSSPLFCDASGDGILGFLAGAAFRIGAESRDEFGELWAPDQGHQELLGHSIYFYTRDTGRPVRFIAPSYALKDIRKIPRYRQFSTKDQGCELWWIEYGGSRDTVHDTEEIKWELWSIVYGVWNHIKNSGEYPEAANLTLDWVGQLPGKRESRRFEGDYMLTQQDVVEQRTHEDAVSYGGWSLDLHPVDAVYSDDAPCTQWHSKGVYQIPYRCLYSRNISNLFLAGRIISATHIAFGSTRVMGSCSHNAQAVGQAAAICSEQSCTPRELLVSSCIPELQRRLTRIGQFIPQIAATDPADLAQSAQVTASSELHFSGFAPSEETIRLHEPCGILVPLQSGLVPEISFFAYADHATELVAELRKCSRPGSYTPDVVLERLAIPLGVSDLSYRATDDRRRTAAHETESRTKAGGNVATAAKTSTATSESQPQPTVVSLPFTAHLSDSCYALICLMANDDVCVSLSDQLVTGTITVSHKQEARVARGAVQEPPPGIGIDSFEFWTPSRRPKGKNIACQAAPAIDSFSPQNVLNGVGRPTSESNAWVAAWDDPQPTLRLSWKTPQQIGQIELSFDPDYDHPLEQVLTPQPEPIMPHCVRSFRIFDDQRQLLHREDENHQARCVIQLPQPVRTTELTIEVDAPLANVPAALFEIRCYAPASG